MSSNFTISDLKKELGPGLGLRKSKYLLEIPVPGSSGKKLNILCRSTSLPERNINTLDIYDKGRKYTVRAETQFAGKYTISVVDDSKMSLRQVFDGWLSMVDNTKPTDNGKILQGGSDGLLGQLGEDVNELMNTVDDVLTSANTLTTSFEQDGGMSFLLNVFNDTYRAAIYQADINIWQLDNNGKKVYGYKLQNAFPSGIGTVELDDNDTSTLSEFSVDFTYSELIPLKDTVGTLVDGVLGSTGTNIVSGIDKLI